MSPRWHALFTKHAWRPERAHLSRDDINAADSDGETLLHIVAFGGDRADVIILIEEGAHINAPGDLGNTPLHLAVMQGHADVVDILLTRGANARLRNEFGETPGDVARHSQRHDLIKRLCKAEIE
ncbi:ankyrin repeat domain-containing protein [Asticcacaulis sp. BYS171W]|uniref:Ankyrin repeat domain-containing protein n=1 Tax=Asticcacaulis aquaticus TaxID=2984212 RepID=A0ABT5HYS1_9CAUL|nr:ankyrin repeat domain-containing protein [Asticcacaulis aquaticus]MDC7685230.1 ankyrin repeat domain-containing protein [Asticcacaulis aquaticus]